MQILHPFAGSITQYAEEISDPDRYRPGHCPQCEAKQPLTGHGFYCRTLVDLAFDGVIRVRRYLRSADRQSRARQSRPDGTHGQLSVQARFERGHRD